MSTTSALEKEVVLEKPAKPFIKWAGGKTKLLPQLLDQVPKGFNRYFEPFLGGGSMFFSLAPKAACLSDTNAELINTYKIIRDDLTALVDSLQEHVYEKDYYYQLRELDRSSDFKKLSAVERASRFIYLNKTCFNGLYRVNSKGEFNVPFGDYKNPKFLDETNLLACSNALKGVELNVMSFDEIEQFLVEGDFVYFDPPYVPTSKTANFTSYTEGGFDLDAQLELARFCRLISEKGVKFMLSNSYTDFVLGAYKEFNIKVISSTRAISSKAKSRGQVNEVLVSNY